MDDTDHPEPALSGDRHSPAFQDMAGIFGTVRAASCRDRPAARIISINPSLRRRRGTPVLLGIGAILAAATLAGSM
ncbi:MAG TPA: hypothetical protein VI199_04450, partial [Novosphingobium sp.]